MRRGAEAGGGRVLITGGAGFIGSNLADALLRSGREVMLFDNLSRPGVTDNVEWLHARHGARVLLAMADVRDGDALADAVRDASAVVHLAAQVAVTQSLDSPLEDFAVNAAGTLHLLEALRRKGGRTPLVFASTNKVYGTLETLALRTLDERHEPADARIGLSGVGEDRPLEFATPYGCSKGAADQYVIDYARSYGLPAAVLRMSCIYGPRQFGTEDQGWVAHFAIRALQGEPVVIFGSGRQVRDILHVDDAVRAYLCVLDRIESLAGRAFNLGGGPGNAVSLLQAIREIERLVGQPVKRAQASARSGDQRYFVADTARLRAATGWQPRIGWVRGLRDLVQWLGEHRVAPALSPGGPDAQADRRSALA